MEVFTAATIVTTTVTIYGFVTYLPLTKVFAISYRDLMDENRRKRRQNPAEHIQVKIKLFLVVVAVVFILAVMAVVLTVTLLKMVPAVVMLKKR
ncbi:hypothetical protein BVC80_6875g1 [Macleaya cordata]|uniref:Transmembrane protein n=1 Tax=Macleaya cordata TaxID=56857 RepID=A0A200PT30_MACCD|nr:hypothetical protein BVC80_6875g1 [Macleaya cordata]